MFHRMPHWQSSHCLLLPSDCLGKRDQPAIVEASDSLLNQQEPGIAYLLLRVGRDIYRGLNAPENSFSAVLSWRASGTSAGGSRQVPRGVWSRQPKGVCEAITVRAFGPEMIECPGLFSSRRNSGHVICDGMGDQEN